MYFVSSGNFYLNSVLESFQQTADDIVDIINILGFMNAEKSQAFWGILNNI